MRLKPWVLILATKRAAAADLRVFLSAGPDEPWPVEENPGRYSVYWENRTRYGGGKVSGLSGLTGKGVNELIENDVERAW